MAAQLLRDAVTISQGGTWNAELRPLCLSLSLLKSLFKVLQLCSGEIQSSATGFMNFGGFWQALGGCMASDRC